MSRRRRQIMALGVVLAGLLVIFFGGIAFELGRYVARMDTDVGLWGESEE